MPFNPPCLQVESEAVLITFVFLAPNAIDMLKRLGRSIFSRKKKDRRQAESSHHAETHASSGSPASHSVPAAAAPIAAAASVGAGAASVAPAVDQPTAAIAAPAHSAEQPAVEERNNDTHHRPQAGMHFSSLQGV